jgi:hypothetical protein
MSSRVPIRRQDNASVKATGKGATLPVAIQVTILALNGLVGLAALVLGVHDSVVAQGQGERALGLSFLLGGGALFAGSLLVCFGDSVAKRRGLYGLALGCLPGFSLVVIQLGKYEIDGRIFVWALAALLPLVTLVLCYRAGLRFVPMRNLTSAVLVTAAVSLFSALLTLRPVAQPETVDAEVSPKVLGYRTAATGERVAVVEPTLMVKNLSKRRLILVGSVYNVLARLGVPRTTTQEQDWNVAAELQQHNWSARFERWGPWTLVETGYDIYGVGDYLEPGSHDVTSITTLVPVGPFNTAHIRVAVATARADRLRLENRSGRSTKHLSNRAIRKLILNGT